MRPIACDDRQRSYWRSFNTGLTLNQLCQALPMASLRQIPEPSNPQVAPLWWNVDWLVNDECFPLWLTSLSPQHGLIQQPHSALNKWPLWSLHYISPGPHQKILSKPQMIILPPWTLSKSWRILDLVSMEGANRRGDKAQPSCRPLVKLGKMCFGIFCIMSVLLDMHIVWIYNWK